MKLAEDLIGKRFGARVVLSREADDKHRNTRWRVLCDCGTESIVTRSSATNSPSCRKCVARRHTRCARGHDLTPENTYWNPSKTKRGCRACKILRSQTAVSKNWHSSYYQANKPRWKKYRRKYRGTPLGKDTERKYRIKHFYKLTREEHLELLESQGYKCAFPDCGTPVDIYSDVDHNHACCPGAKSCGRCVRGVLCHQHNNGLSFFEDRPKTLLNAFEYLKKENL